MNPTDDMDDAAWARVLFDLRYGDDFCCRTCGHRRASQLESRPKVFSCHACGAHHSVTAGTPLHGCKVPLAKVAWAAQLLASNTSVSARELARIIGVCVETAWTLCHRLRAGLAACRPHLQAGDVVMTELAVRLRDVKPAVPGEPRWHPVVLVATDGTSRAAAEVTTDRWFAPTHLVNRCSEQRELGGWAQGHHVAHWIGSILENVHCSVSSRWVGHYVGALAAIQTMAVDRLDHVRATLSAAMRRAVPGIAANRPPRFHWHPSFKPYATPLNPMQLEHVTLPLDPEQRVPLRYGRLGPAPPPDPG